MKTYNYSFSGTEYEVYQVDSTGEEFGTCLGRYYSESGAFRRINQLSASDLADEYRAAHAFDGRVTA